MNKAFSFFSQHLMLLFKFEPFPTKSRLCTRIRRKFFVENNIFREANWIFYKQFILFLFVYQAGKFSDVKPNQNHKLLELNIAGKDTGLRTRDLCNSHLRCFIVAFKRIFQTSGKILNSHIAVFWFILWIKSIQSDLPPLMSLRFPRRSIKVEWL